MGAGVGKGKQMQFEGSTAQGQSQGPLRTILGEGGKVVGCIRDWRGVRSLVKTRVRPEIHRLKYPFPAWAVDLSALQESIASGVKQVVLVEDGGEAWMVSTETLLERGRRIERGYGRQIALAVRFWSHGADKTEADKQLLLFGGAVA